MIEANYTLDGRAIVLAISQPPQPPSVYRLETPAEVKTLLNRLSELATYLWSLPNIPPANAGRGRVSALQITLSAQDRRMCMQWQTHRAGNAAMARRGRVLLLVAQGRSITQVAQMVGTSRRFVYKWIHRYQAEGLDGLIDCRRFNSGRPSKSTRPEGNPTYASL